MNKKICRTNWLIQRFLVINKMRIFYIFLFLTFQTSLYSHQSALSYLKIVQKENDIDITLKKPLADINSDDIKVKFPKSCKNIINESIEQDRNFIIFKKTLSCSKNELYGSTIWIENLLKSDKGVVFDYKSDNYKISNYLIKASKPYVVIKNSAIPHKFSISYLKLGIWHILSGIDHLLFVLALLLLVSNPSTLIFTISAFTLSHSLTLALSTLGFIDISLFFTEAMIALSIVFIAAENLNEDKKTVAKRYPYLIAFIFGLLHGLGFANALFEIGLQKESIAASLLFFNIGVETGQLVFIFFILMIIKIFNKLTTKYNKIFSVITSYAIGITAAFWFIQRSVAAFSN